ncbi:hypothetical protein CBR_g39963 [Chara braunii]|uniref:CCHC-type domain-containing protein n=1 Tax=Chara braunii TaxID=69332 RepID=A0A388K1N2_CHABU|nr:hypothetical protein CBR_g39963 [Chara braunii]|eukprot:GBG63960.1 hypothetical protein CBR_g39963 [Chara braunii]
MPNNEQHDGGGNSGGDGDHRPYRHPTCFNCREAGHYANEFPYRERRQFASRPSTSSDSRRSRSPRRMEYMRHYSPPGIDKDVRSQIAELNKNLVSIKQFHDAEQAKKEEKARRKREKEEAKRCEAEEVEKRAIEEAKREAKQQKKREKARNEAELRAEMRKDMSLQCAIMLSEIKDSWVEEWRQTALPAVRAVDPKGKKKLQYEVEEVVSDASGDGSETSVTQELSEKTGKLFISEKRKREANVVLEGSPPMETSAKRTPKRGTGKQTDLSMRLTRSKTAKKTGRIPIPAKKKTPVKTPLSKIVRSAKKKTPQSRATPDASGALARLRYRDAVIKELKDLEAPELQKICRDEGLHYDKKIEAIFDIVEHQTQITFEEAPVDEAEVIRIADSGNTEEVNQPDGKIE